MSRVDKNADILWKREKDLRIVRGRWKVKDDYDPTDRDYSYPDKKRIEESVFQCARKYTAKYYRALAKQERERALAKKKRERGGGENGDSGGDNRAE